jgi:hypothetical protein
VPAAEANIKETGGISRAEYETLVHRLIELEARCAELETR